MGFCLYTKYGGTKMYTVYIIQSVKTGRYYIGHTVAIQKRLFEHNEGLTCSTRNYRPWHIVYTKIFSTKSMAQHIELKIKRMKSRKFIEKLIANEIDDSFYV